ncbi:MAG TPA: cell division protein ZapA [Saprospiraceae bacterium]|nr:cell division protein ZapA [Saprospiraceae bacterium]
MDGQQTKNITVVIANRPYPLKVKQEDEAAIRKIIKELNEQVNRFQLTYANKDKQDCLAMAALTNAVDLYKTKKDTAQDSTISSQLARLDQLLGELTSQE